MYSEFRGKTIILPNGDAPITVEEYEIERAKELKIDFLVTP